jgi:hypothetical protein
MGTMSYELLAIGQNLGGTSGKSETPQLQEGFYGFSRGKGYTS